MQTVVLVIHLMIAASLVFVVLLQRSEGGALGIGGGGGGFLTGRGQANLLTRITAGLALAFFISSISLSILGHRPAPAAGSIIDQTSTSAPASAPAAPAPSGDTTAPATPAPPAPPASGAPASAPAQPAAPRGGILDKLE